MSNRVFIRDLSVGDVFTFVGDSTRNVVEYRFNEGGWTTINYRPVGGDHSQRSRFASVGLTTVDKQDQTC